MQYLRARTAPLGLPGNILTAALAVLGVSITASSSLADSPRASLAPPSVPVTKQSTSPVEVVLQVTPTSPRPGETIYWLVRLRNRTSKEIHLVADTENELVPRASFFATSTNGHGLTGPRLSSTPPSQWISHISIKAT